MFSFMNCRRLFIFLFATLFAIYVDSQETFNCPVGDTANRTTHHAHPTNCTLFFKCLHGIAYLNKCPDDLRFNPNLEVCDWAR